MTLPINELCDNYLRHYPVDGDDYDIDGLADDCKILAAEVERLAKVIERLPVTADGVPVVPGMTVWMFDPGEPGGLSPETAGLVSETRWKPLHGHPGSWDLWPSGADCYSTEAAARWAKEKTL